VSGELLSPTLRDCVARYEAARVRAGALVEELSDDGFHRAPPGGGWSVAACLEHLVVSGQKVADRIERAAAEGRAAGRTASERAAREPVKLGYFARLFVKGTAAGKDGGKPPMKTAVREPFDPGDPKARGRGRGAVLADFLALQERLRAAARAADGLDLARITTSSVLAAWLKIPIGGWFLVLAGHQERHLDQAERAKAAVTAAAQGGTA
jgi:hypothetical protein